MVVTTPSSTIQSKIVEVLINPTISDVTLTTTNYTNVPNLSGFEPYPYHGDINGFKIGELTYYVYTQSSNMFDSSVAAFDKNNNLIKSWRLNSIRYIDSITIDASNNLIFTGQSTTKSIMFSDFWNF